MIIRISHTEAKNFVALALNLTGTPFELEIVKPNAQILDAFRTAISEHPLHASVSKITSIKRFRELCGRHIDRDGFSCCDVSLTDAKWAVENSTVALANLERTGNIRG